MILRLRLAPCVSILLSALAFVSVFAASASATTRAARPNILVILTDDQRLDALGASGNPRIHTPNLDALARRSVRFTNAHVVMSLCSPSRATVLTGHYGSTNGVTTLDDPLRAGETTFAQHLKAEGYRTAMSGKWHIGGPPAEAGFDFTCFFRANGAYVGRQVWDEGREVRPAGHVDDYCVDRSIAFLENAATRPEPFLLFHNTQLPHMNEEHAWPSLAEFRDRYDPGKLPLPPTVAGDLAGKPPYLETVRNRTQADHYGYQDPARVREHIRDYYAVVTQLDAMVGRLLAAVDRLKLRDNTWIIFMSDNGWLLGEHRMTSKVLAYSDSIRVPLLIAGPGVTPRVETRLALNLDLAPTVLEMARIRGHSGARSMHGTSLMPLVRDDAASWREAFIYECLDGYGGTKPMLGALTADWSLIETWDARDAVTTRPAAFRELYDRRADPAEAHNRYGTPETRAVAERLERAIESHIARHLRANDSMR
ncbi:MAG TPA: sulfatase-like hydrolase/transferase [Opitutaceae bacterium]